MARPDPNRRKIRTRQHVIADLGVNYTQRQVLLAGHTAEEFGHDYGIDLEMKTYSPNGEVEGGHIGIQVKATDHLARHADGTTFAIRVSMSDLKAWLMDWVPVVLVVYDAAADLAYWLDVQDYAQHHDVDEFTGGATVTLRVPLANVFDVDAVRSLRDRKQRCVPPK